MSNFSNGKIYKITGGGLTYIGSTTETIEKRLNRHKAYLKENRYCASRDVIVHDDCKIELLELFPCENKKQLIEREQYYLSQIENCNKNRALAKPREYKVKDINKIKAIPKLRDYKAEYEKRKSNPEVYRKYLDRTNEYKQRLKNNI
jgi:Uri superfamily endonuclease